MFNAVESKRFGFIGMSFHCLLEQLLSGAIGAQRVNCHIGHFNIYIKHMDIIYVHTYGRADIVIYRDRFAPKKDKCVISYWLQQHF